jgi:hypothetical protein
LDQIGNDLPDIVKNRVISILQADPMANDLFILLQILSCPLYHSADGYPFFICQWLFDDELFEPHRHGNRKLDNLMSYITKKVSEAVESFNPFEGTEMHPMNFNLVSGPSVQTAIEYSNHFSYLNYAQTGGEDVVFTTLDEFCGYYNFPSDDQIICVPISRELFENTNFSDEQIETALSCIVFTSPSYLWSLYQLLSSESNQHLNVFSMDGTYSI